MQTQTPVAAYLRATSLGAVRDLQLTRVPWLDRLGFQASHHVSAMLRPFTTGFLSPADAYSMVTNALYLGNNPSHGDDLRLFVVFPNLDGDIRNNSRLLACFWQRCMLPAIEALQTPRKPQDQSESMDYVSYNAGDEMKDLDESLATFALHTPITRHDSTQLFSLDQAWESIQEVVANDAGLQGLKEMFLIVAWESSAVISGSRHTSSFEQSLNLALIDQNCGKVIYEEMQQERPAYEDTRKISRKRSATLTQLEDRPHVKRNQSVDMTC